MILVDAWPTQVHHWLNADHRDGVLYLIAGGVGLCAAIASPFVLAPAEARSPREPEVASPPEPEPTPEEPRAKPELVAAPDAS